MYFLEHTAGTGRDNLAHNHSRLACVDERFLSRKKVVHDAGRASYPTSHDEFVMCVLCTANTVRRSVAFDDAATVRPNLRPCRRHNLSAQYGCGIIKRSHNTYRLVPAIVFLQTGGTTTGRKYTRRAGISSPSRTAECTLHARCTHMKYIRVRRLCPHKCI